MSKKITRRALGSLMAAVAASAQQAPAPLPSSPEEELAAARNTAKANFDQIAKVKLPMSTEPATHFKA